MTGGANSAADEAAPDSSANRGAIRSGPAWLAPGALFAAAAALFIFHLGSYGLWEPDEARYAEIAREMIGARDFLLPHLNYVAYVEKPPLLYWLTALSFSALATTELAARLPAVFSAIAGLVATWYFTARVFDRRRALLAGAIVATSPLYAVMAQVLLTDMLLSALVTIALFAFFLFWRDGRARWRWTFFVAMGFAMLTKGLVGIVLPLACAGVFLWWRGELLSGLRRLGLISGFALIALIAGPWFIAMLLRQPGFGDFYFVGEHLRRFIEFHYSHGEPLYFYLPVLAAGMLPWSLLAVFIRRPPTDNAAWDFCAISAGLIFVLFSTASSKLIPYILPALPPLAVLIADGILRDSPTPKSTTRFAWTGIVLALAGCGAIAVSLMAVRFRGEYLPMIRTELAIVGVLVLAGGVAAWRSLKQEHLTRGLAALALTVAAALVTGSYARLRLEPLRSYAALSRQIAAAQPNAPAACYHRYVQALPFYTGKRVIQVGPRSELDFGAAHSSDAPQWFLDSDDQLIALWKTAAPVVVLDQPDLDKLGPRLGNYRVIAAEHRKRAIVPGN